METIILELINKTLESFDFPFCITVNIATYLVIKTITNYKKKSKVSTWNKRLIFILISTIIAIVYCLIGNEIRTIFNSFILAPVFWSWILKPICKYFKIDYKDINILD